MTTMPTTQSAALEPNLRGIVAPRVDDWLLRSRARRINLALLAVVLMGLADLAYTLIYMHGSGMIESNPIARTMVEIGSARQLVLYKLLTLTVCCGAIYFCRQTRQAEFGSWLCCGVMFLLTLHWVNYNHAVADMTSEFAMMAEFARMSGSTPVASQFVLID